MPKVILKLSLFLFVLLSRAGFVAEAFGKQQPPNPALRGFSEGCLNHHAALMASTHPSRCGSADRC